MVLYGVPSGLQGNFREYIQVKLSDTLEKDKTYCVSFYTSRADSFSRYATSRLGSHVSTAPVTNFSQNLISVTPQIQNPLGSMLIDPLGWTEISGLYSASGGENYITIGNFYDDNNTDTISTSGFKFGTLASYYYIDDVSVTEYITANVATDTVICAGLGIDKNLLPTFGALYNWSVIAGDANSLDSNNVASPIFSPSVTTIYILQKQQCGIISYDTLLIRVPQNYPAIAPNDTSICIGDTISLTAANNCTWCAYGWNTGANAIQINVNPYQNTIYIFSQTDSCFTTSDTVTVNIEYCGSQIVTAPNIFTPNGDEINDVWLPTIENELSLTEYSLVIFNRWGITVFETNEYKAGWDGRTTSGIECIDGTYYYILKYVDLKTGQRDTSKGFLQLLK